MRFGVGPQQVLDLGFPRIEDRQPALLTVGAEPVQHSRKSVRVLRMAAGFMPGLFAQDDQTGLHDPIIHPDRSRR